MRLEFKWITFVVLVLSLATLACNLTLFEPTPAPFAAATAAPPSAPTAIPGEISISADAEELLLINIYQRVNPAVVNIVVGIATDDGALTDIGSGSGFVIDHEGHIVTNYHVVVDAEEVRVTFSDGSIAIAEVLGGDAYSDIAVLQVDVPPDQLAPVEMGESASLQVGQRVIAIGNPFGLTGSMTTGIVSGVGRTLPSGVFSESGGFSNPLIIQTDAAINPGNSGGPLLDSHGRVIGVSVAIRSQTGLNSGVGFAVPVDTVRRVVPQLIEEGQVNYPYLGIGAQNTFSMAELGLEFDLPATEGVLIQSVTPGTAADRAGLRGGAEEVNFRGIDLVLGGDVIIAIDGNPIRDFDELLGYLVTYTSVGQEIIVTIVRDGETLDIPVTLGARPE